ncbi:MAG TPA: R3H domain-containing nucleic acid-binding protein [Bryobacteraceae bacterium]|nr:R3H domain-containing nucleic acid-binding protein [Bryobacteraceae bacterium]
MSRGRFTVAASGQRIDDFLRRILELAGLVLRFRLTEAEARDDDFETPNIVVRFSGPDTDLLLSNKAELMLSLEQLTMEMLRMEPDEHSQLQFDANDYRALRIEELRLSALAAADRVKRTKMPFHFNPMNSRERRIIHLALRSEPEVRSESTGMGPQRAVVIYPAGMPASPGVPGRPTFPPRRGGRRR